MASKTLKVFFRRGLVCSACGLEGKFFALERHLKHEGNLFSPNLYGVDKDGNQVMFTKDHLIPLAAGGPDSFDNLVPMCERCNGQKGASYKKVSRRLRIKIRKSAQKRRLRKKFRLYSDSYLDRTEENDEKKISSRINSI